MLGCRGLLVKQGVQVFGGAGQGALIHEQSGLRFLDLNRLCGRGPDNNGLRLNAPADSPPEQGCHQDSGGQTASEG